MSRWVIDASIAVKWLLPELHSGYARAIATRDAELLAPELIWAEVGNAVLKRVRSNDLSPIEAADLLRDFRDFSVTTFPLDRLLDGAFSMARDHRASLYDCLYLSLAVALGERLVTADHQFFDLIEGRRIYTSHVVWIEDIA